MERSPIMFFRFSIPPKSLWPNARPHWRQKSADKKAYRNACEMIAREKLAGTEPKLEKCKIVSSWVFRSKRRRDADNLIGALKSAIDALKLAGVLSDDDLTSVEYGHPQVVVVPESMSEYVVLNIFEVNE